MGIGWGKEGNEGEITKIVYYILVHCIYVHHVLSQSGRQSAFFGYVLNAQPWATRCYVYLLLNSNTSPDICVTISILYVTKQRLRKAKHSAQVIRAINGAGMHFLNYNIISDHNCDKGIL